MIRSFGKANENDSGSSPFDLFDIMFGELFRNYEMLRRKTRTEKGIESIHLPVPLLILRRKRVQVATHSRRKGLQDVVCPHLWYRRFCSRMKGKRNKGDPSIRRNKRRENEEDEGETRGEGVGWGKKERRNRLATCEVTKGTPWQGAEGADGSPCCTFQRRHGRPGLNPRSYVYHGH